MLEVEQIKDSLEKARIINFANFSDLTLDKSAVLLLKNLFLNPDCVSLSDLGQFAKKAKVKLKEVAREIITAAPQTIAKFSQRRGLTDLTASDILECFSLDHLTDIKNNKIAEFFSPGYAIGHSLLFGQIKDIRNTDNQKIATIVSNYGKKEIIFKNVLVPANLNVKKGSQVSYHFGVVVSICQLDDILTNNLKLKQAADENFNEWLSAYHTEKVIIDYYQERVFQQKVFEKIITGPVKKDYYKKQKISEKKKEKIMNNLRKIKDNNKVIYSH